MFGSVRGMVAVGASALLVFGLSGCANPIDELVQQGTEQAIEKAVEDATGGQVDIDTGSGASVPTDWPTEIPVPDGEIQLSAKNPDGMVLAVLAAAGSQDTVIADLESAGYTIASDVNTGDARMVILEGAAWNVMLTIAPDTSDSSKVLLNYVVTPVTP